MASHNHVTRDIKETGNCPACDEYHLEPINTDDLPLTQELIMEVLAARYRLGENLWPFPTKVKRSLDALESLGLIGHKSGVVERTRNAWLTDLGKASVLSPTYTTPGRL